MHGKGRCISRKACHIRTLLVVAVYGTGIRGEARDEPPLFQAFVEAAVILQDFQSSTHHKQTWVTMRGKPERGYMRVSHAIFFYKRSTPAAC